MQNMATMANATGNERCVAAMPDAADAWQCLFAETLYTYIETPLFVVNSALDPFQTQCILSSRLHADFPNTRDPNLDTDTCSQVPGYAECGLASLDGCSSAQMATFVDYMSTFQYRLKEVSSPSHSYGNGAFLYSCLTHCAGVDDAQFNTIAIGDTTMQESLAAWWQSEGELTQKHTHLPCMYNNASDTPHRCNPSCAPH